MNGCPLKCERLAKRFREVVAVKDASFRVSRNSITAFLGENGAGKTTTLKLALGFLRPDSGSAELAACRVGYVPERPAFFPWLTGKEIIAATARGFGSDLSEWTQKIERLSVQIGFETALLERRVPIYSLGNQKKFSYLQSLLISPDLLIVDEPFSSLDPLSIKNMRDHFLKLKSEGKTLFLSTHLISEAEKICDEFIIINKGTVVVQEKWVRGLTGLEAIFLSLTR
jgi:ABC-2 type transport system ATP-binding protein